MKSLTEKLNILVNKGINKDARLQEKVKNVREEDYEIYEPLMAGLNVHETTSALQNLWFILRRIITVMTIILLKEKWKFVQLQLFMICSLATLTFECYAKPFNSRYQNFIEVFNELIVLLVSYQGLQLLYSSWSPEMMYHVGTVMTAIILTGIAVNLLLILWNMIYELRLKCLHCK